MQKWVLCIVCLFICVVNLGSWAFNDADEATYAEVYHESVSRQDFLTLSYNHASWFEKPPLYFWLSTIPVAIFGEHEFALRFVSSLLTVGCVVLIYLISLEETDDELSAVLSSIVLMTTAFFIFSGRQVRLDIPVIFTILFGFLSFLKARKRPLWYLSIGVSTATGVLLKSIIGLLIYPILLLYAVVHKDFLWLKDKWFWLGNIVALMLILPWHAYEFHLFGSTFIQQYVVWNLLSRTTEAVTVGANTGIGYYIWQYLLLTQPWFIAFFALLSIFLFKRKDMKGKRSYPFMLFTAFSSIGVFILFIIPKTRLLYYFLPALPFMSLYIGTHSSQIIRKYKNVGGIVFGLFAFVGLIHVILTTFSLSDRGFFLESINQVSRDALAQEERNVVEIAAKNKLTLYIYDWNFIATLIYYSQIHNGFEIQRLTDTSQLRSPFLLLIPTPLFVQGISLPIKLDSAYKVSIVYKGPAATLVKFDK